MSRTSIVLFVAFSVAAAKSLSSNDDGFQTSTSQRPLCTPRIQSPVPQPTVTSTSSSEASAPQPAVNFTQTNGALQSQSPMNPTPSTEAPVPPSPVPPSPVNPAPTTEAPVPQPSEPSAPSGTLNADQQEIFDYVNDERTQRGLQALTPAADIQREAQNWAEFMSQGVTLRANFRHRNPLAENITSPYMFLGENIALNPTILGAHEGLMDSPGHRENILRPIFNRVGMGVAFANGVYYVCQIFMQV